MIKILVSQQLYNFADEAFEYQLLDPQNFLRLQDMNDSGNVPKTKTI